MNLKNIIEGTEDNIRLEVTKAGGFATESQVRALSNARNKQNIKDYNRLQDMIASKEKMLNTLIGLEAEDRAAVDRRFNTLFSIDKQIIDYKTQFTRDARNTLQSTIDNIGYKGLLKSLGGDEREIALAERTLGMAPGGS